MKQKAIFKTVLLVLLCMLTSVYAHAAKQRKVVVSNEVQFVAALASNTRIQLSEGTQLNLSRVLQGITQSDFYKLEPSTLSGVFAGSGFDGEELILSGLENITIEGLGRQPVLIEVEPRYAYVLRFLRCKNIRLKNLKLGHTLDNPGYCSGGVLDFNASSNIEIIRCDLYGCGIEGITTTNVTGMKVYSTTIHDCTYSIMTLQSSRDIYFDGCTFKDNREFGMLNVDGGCDGITFDSCTFSNNQGQLFAVDSPVLLKNCMIYHPEETIGNKDYVTDSNSMWIDQ